MKINFWEVLILLFLAFVSHSPPFFSGKMCGRVEEGGFLSHPNIFKNEKFCYKFLINVFIFLSCKIKPSYMSVSWELFWPIYCILFQIYFLIRSICCYYTVPASQCSQSIWFPEWANSCGRETMEHQLRLSFASLFFSTLHTHFLLVRWTNSINKVHLDIAPNFRTPLKQSC